MKSLSIIVITVIFSTLLNQNSITTEARQLKKTDGQIHLKAAGSTDAFVPTSPGNSPGVGHKKDNANVDQGFQDDVKHTEGRRLEKTQSPNYFETGSKDDFAPTSPGNSPGIGHKKANENVKESKDDFEPREERRLKKTDGKDYAKTGSTDDFAPTSPGNSPGMGHKKGKENVRESKGEFESTEEKRLKKTEDQEYSKTGSTDDFAPTTPGNSPGMGHKKGDDFKPTTPGHSPGIGHTIKNDEPKA